MPRKRNRKLPTQPESLHKREFIVSAKQWRAFTAALARPAQIKPEVARLFSQKCSRNIEDAN